MNDLEHRLGAEGRLASPPFSEERHRRLLTAMGRKSGSRLERPLRSCRGWGAACMVIVMLPILAVFMTRWHDAGEARDPAERAAAPTPRDFGVPVRLAERSVLEVHGVASRLAGDPARPLCGPADDAMQFFAGQVSLARSLAITPQRKPPV